MSASKEEHHMQINMEWVQRKNIICKSAWSGFKRRISYANQPGVGSKEEHHMQISREGSNEKYNMQISMEWVQMKNIICKSAWGGFKLRT